MADLQSRLSQFLKDLYAGVLQINNGSTPNVYELVKVVTGLADASATAVLTVTIPNGNHAAALELTFLSSNGGSEAWDSSRTGRGTYVVARVTDAAAVGQAASISNTAIGTVAASETHTLAYSIAAMSGAAGAVNTQAITVTIDDSGQVGSNQVV